MNWRVWGWPVVLAVATSVALIAALLSDVAWWDGVWSAALAWPVAVALRRAMRRGDAR